MNHTGPAIGYLKVIEQSGYNVSGSGIKITEFEVKELDCIDCAQKFEKAIQLTPGVFRASLNFTMGRLTVEHTCDTEDLIAAASDIGYTINGGQREKGSVLYTVQAHDRHRRIGHLHNSGLYPDHF